MKKQEQFVRLVRERENEAERFIAWSCAGFGVAYIVIGLFFFRQLGDFSRNLLWMLPMGACFTCGLAGEVCRWLFQVRCNHCGKRLNDSELAVALHRCPHCNAKLFEEQSLSGIALPQSYTTVRPGLYLIVFVLLFSWGWLKWSGDDFDIVSGLRWTLVATGAGLTLFPLALKYSKGRWIKRLQVSKQNVCLVCAEQFREMYLRYTGNCSVCGSRIDPDWPPPEPEPVADLPAWEQRKTLRKCPYCPSNLMAVTYAADVKTMFGRCQHCRRKLTKEEDKHG